MACNSYPRGEGALCERPRWSDGLYSRGVRVRIGNTVYDPSDPMGRLLVNVLAMVAEFSVIWTRRDGRLPELNAAA